jgi:hypothetical protein
MGVFRKEGSSAEHRGGDYIRYYFINPPVGSICLSPQPRSIGKKTQDKKYHTIKMQSTNANKNRRLDKC